MSSARKRTFVEFVDAGSDLLCRKCNWINQIMSYSLCSLQSFQKLEAICNQLQPEKEDVDIMEFKKVQSFIDTDVFLKKKVLKWAI